MATSQEQLIAAYARLPRPVREYLLGSDLTDMAQALGKEYELHVDTIGGLLEIVTQMLLGLVNPAQFQQALGGLGIPPATVTAIMHELNEKVFKPLQDRIKNAPPEEPAIEESEPDATPESAPTPLPRAPSLPPPAVFQPTSAAPVMPAPTPIAPTHQAAPVLTPAQPVPAPIPLPKPMSISEPAPVRPSPVPTIVPVTLPRVPPVPMPRPNQPVYTAQAPLAGPTLPAATPESAKAALHEVLKGYGVDPYREVPE